jgi:hypothetical protein
LDDVQANEILECAERKIRHLATLYQSTVRGHRRKRKFPLPIRPPQSGVVSMVKNLLSLPPSR